MVLTFLSYLFRTCTRQERKLFLRSKHKSTDAIDSRMVERINVKGYDEFKKTVQGLAGKKQINAYFTGSKNEQGVSWCPDCVSAEPHALSAVDKFSDKDAVFVYVDVGGRDYWKDRKNPFRTDKDIHIQVIPTLIRWKGHQRLEGDQLEKEDLLEMFFTDD